MSIANQPLATAQVITANTNTAAINAPAETVGEAISVIVAATAVSGTSPSLTASLQWSADGTNFYAANPADSLQALTAAGGVAQVFTVKAPYYRLAFTITGTTPSFTVTANAFTA